MRHLASQRISGHSGTIARISLAECCKAVHVELRLFSDLS